MPELPEVQTIVNDLKPLLVNKSIVRLQVLDSRLQNLAETNNRTLITNHKITDLSRRAKNLVIQLANRHYLVVHLKMTGQLIWLNQQKWLAGGHPTKDLSALAKPHWPNKSTRLIIELSDGSRLFFNDTRKFGWLKLMDVQHWQNYQASLGIEPLDPAFSLDKLQEAIRRHPRAKIKALLLDQRQIVGLGNIYVDESLFAARIRPDRLAGQVKPAEITRLHDSIVKVLTQAIASRGTSFSDYRDGQGRRGNFSEQLRVYGRDRQPCYHCGGTVQKMKLAGRGTHFCPNCQK